MKKKKILLLLIGFILISTSGVGGIAFFAPEIIPGSIKNIPDLLKDSLPFMAKKDPGKPEKPETPEKKEEKKTQEMAGHLYNPDPFMVNLVDTGKMRYLKIRMSLESS
ncbi:MAG: flagellar basal body-associated FliL family protein, partial [Deltaproteobacteria bacterium]|nr:flagellar basal body-associated FliL family protein [Deltaproteobacteria bacterium]